MAIGDPNLIAGIGTLSIDGTQWALRANLTVSPDLVTREGLAGEDRVHGYRESPRVPFIEAELSLQPNQAVTDLALGVVGDSTVVAMLADGRTFQLNQAWYKGESSIVAQDGQWLAHFEGMTCFEILATAA